MHSACSSEPPEDTSALLQQNEFVTVGVCDDAARFIKIRSAL